LPTGCIREFDEGDRLVGGAAQGGPRQARLAVRQHFDGEPHRCLDRAFESVTRAHAKIVDEANELPLSNLPRPVEDDDVTRDLDVTPCPAGWPTRRRPAMGSDHGGAA